MAPGVCRRVVGDGRMAVAVGARRVVVRAHRVVAVAAAAAAVVTRLPPVVPPLLPRCLLEAAWQPEVVHLLQVVVVLLLH